MGDGGLTLAIVACGPQIEVALGGPRLRAASLVRLAGVSPRSTLLLAAADLLVEDAGGTPDEIDRVVVSRGPGSFTGIRAGIATGQGLAAANGADLVAFDSLLTQAARCSAEGVVWAAQPGRRGEIYARGYRIDRDSCPRAEDEITVLPVTGLGDRGPWVAAESLELGSAVRVETSTSAAEALLRLAGADVDPEPVEPLYVEAPPIHRTGRS